MRVPGERPEHRALFPVLQSFARTHRYQRDGAYRRRRAIREPSAPMGFRCDHRKLGRVAFSGQRAARLLGLAGRRPAGLAQSRRDQERGGGRADRARNLRQEPRRARRGHQGARPRAFVEFLRRSAMDLRQGAHRALGSLQPSRSVAEIRPLGVSDRVVVGRGESGKGGVAVTSTRRQILKVAAGCAAATGLSRFLSTEAFAQEREAHGISAFGDLKYPAGFRNFDYVDPKAPKGGAFSQIGPNRQFNQSFLTFNSLNSYILKGDAAQG